MQKKAVKKWGNKNTGDRKQKAELWTEPVMSITFSTVALKNQKAELIKQN